MDLIIITGFLGSGKTTLLNSIAKMLSRNNKKVAIIENEVGSVGVDDDYLRQQGLMVKEIFSGCICCSLRINLVSTLLELERDYAPDIVIIEPSGVAGPKQVLSSLQCYGGEINSKRVISIIDAKRFAAIEKLSMPLITDAIEIADMVLINKIDTVNSGRLDEIKNRILNFRADANIMAISALQGTNMEQVEKYLLIEDEAGKLVVTANQTAVNQNIEDMPKPAVHSSETEILFEKKLSFDFIRDLICDFFDRVVLKIKTAGGEMIGHLKAIIKTEKCGYLLISATSFEVKPQIKGRLADDADSIRMTINAIVYGIDKKILAEIIEEELVCLRD